MNALHLTNYPMNHYYYLKPRVCLLGLCLAVGTSLQGQAVDDEDVFELSPFEVSGDGSIGYQATETLAGTRLRTDLRDVANAVSVVNKEFLQDTGATSQADLLLYTTSTEVGGIQGNFANTGDGANLGDNASRTDPQSNTRIRGLARADNTRNFFLTDIPWDSYIVDQVDIQRGANSILFGVGSPAGIINTNIIDPMFADQGKIDLQIGSHGSYRATIDINQQVIPDELAIRVAGLYDDTEFQQDPAYEKDTRLFGAVRWDPSFLQSESVRTSISVNYENGDIDANRPRILPPIDRISRWWSLGQPTYDVTQLDNPSYDDWVAAGMPGDGWAALRGFFDNGTVNPNFEPWLNLRGGDFFDGPLVVYGNENASEQDFITPAQWLAIPTAGPAGSPAVPFSPWAGIATVNEWANNL